MSLVKIMPNQGLSSNAIKSSAAPVGGKSFQKVMENVRQALDGKEFNDLAGLQQVILDGKKLDGRNMLVYQIKAQQMHLKAELISKAAESVNGTFKRLQQA